MDWYKSKCIEIDNHFVFVFLDGITPADGSVSPDYFSDILPQNGDLHHRG